MSPLLIVGASARAAAHSALRAGLAPFAADLFADVDLAARCHVAKAADYPNGLALATTKLPAGPWMYVGALENAPDVISSIAAARPLLGNSADVVRRVRDPLALRALLERGGFRSPRVVTSAHGLPTDGSWLKKRTRSGGGAHVSRWHGADVSLDAEPGWHFQEFIAGATCAALFVAANGQSRLLGVTDQLLAGDQRPDRPFRYDGSCGPCALRPELHDRLEALGEWLARETGLHGVFGVDFVLSEEEPWIIEVNPRYPASAEIIERATGVSVVGLHVAACRDGKLPDRVGRWCDERPRFGKRIVYARAARTIDAAWQKRALAAALCEWPEIVDVPTAGSIILPDHPIATVFASGQTGSQTIERLMHTAGAWFEASG